MSSKRSTSHPTHSRSMSDEADIGSGEKAPGQQETESIIEAIPPLGTDGNSARDTGGGQRQRDDVERADVERGSAEVERDPEQASENDRAGHGQIQREQGRSRQDAGPDMTPDAAV